MAKTAKNTAVKKTPEKTKPKSVPAPSSLVLKLGAPGMTPMHRAGLGGLAATLIALERSEKKKKDFNWSVSPTEITLDFGKPENAGACLDWLFSYAFQIKNGLIYLPGQYDEKIPALEVRARLQQGLTLTFLQHGQTRKLGEEQVASYDFEKKKFEYTYKECFSYAHQTAWKEWINNKGELVITDYDVQGPVNPGAVVRHVAYTGPTKVSQPLELVLPLQFALIGTLSLPINRAVGVLIVPYVGDLEKFGNRRVKLTPASIKETFVAGTGDAVLQLEIRRRGHSSVHTVRSSGGDAISFRPMPWSTQQKSRSEILSVANIDKELLKFYQRVLTFLPPRIAQKINEIKTGRGKNATTKQEIEYFWADSVVRPFIANNVAQGKLWFADFTRLANSTDPASGKPLWNKIRFEQKGLNEMVNDEKLDWKLDGARSLVLAVQEALRSRYGQVASDKGVAEAGMKNRLEGEYEKWRLAFSGAKTPEQFRFSLSDMFSRAKTASELKSHWEKITQLILQDWQLARDLALIGLASYKGKESESQDDNTPSNKQDK